MNKIEQNRQKALQRLKQRGLLHTDGTVKDTASSNTPTTTALPVQHKLRPTIRKSDYIDYDFAQLNNLNGGYINKYGDNDDGEQTQLKTLSDWKQQQRDSASGLDTTTAESNGADAQIPVLVTDRDKCSHCRINIELDPILQKVFHVRVCKQCVRQNPDKYSLLTKTECKTDYLLTESELNDTDIFRKYEKSNPHSGTFARMQLFLRQDIEKFAWDKWGGPEGLDQEWEKRELGKQERKEKRYKKQIETMRLKTRSQEFTKRLRDKKYGNLKHKHSFTEILSNQSDDMGNKVVKKRCNDCGMEIEDFDI